MHLAATLPIMAAAILSTSCIYEKPPGDDFYRTLWKSDEIPLGPLGVEVLLLEFLCDQAVRIQLDGGPDLYGTYSPDGTTTVLNDLHAYFSSSNGLILTEDDSGNGTSTDDGDGSDRSNNGTSYEGNITVTFIEAHRNGDTLFLLWRVEDAVYPFTTALQRLPDYED